MMHDAGSIPQQTVLEGGHRVRAALHYSARACYGETINRTSRVCVIVARQVLHTPSMGCSPGIPRLEGTP